MWPILVRRDRAMGCAIEVQIALNDLARASEADAALDAAISAIHTTEEWMSRFRPDSELSLLNRSTDTWYTASADLFAVVAEALEWAHQTQGIFDPTLLATLTDLGYDTSFEHIAHRDIGSAASPSAPPRALLGNYRRVRLDHLRRAVWLPAGVGIDLGGIGKGWTADRVLDRALAGFANALVNIGGDLALRGGLDRGKGWVIGLRDPRDELATEPRYLGGMALRQGGVATSGAAWRWWRRGGQRLHHLVDPRTGQPATTAGIDPDPQALIGVTALAQTATAAEVYAKYALLLGMPTCLAALNRGLDIAGVCIMGDGSIIPSTNMYSFLAAHGE